MLPPRSEVRVSVSTPTADALQDEHLRETFLAAAPVREILDSAAR
jgi:hypothetical protein